MVSWTGAVFVDVPINQWGPACQQFAPVLELQNTKANKSHGLHQAGASIDLSLSPVPHCSLFSMSIPTGAFSLIDPCSLLTQLGPPAAGIRVSRVKGASRSEVNSSRRGPWKRDVAEAKAPGHTFRKEIQPSSGYF